MPDQESSNQAPKENLFTKLINAKDLTRDVKLLSFGIGVVASIYWLSYDLHRSKEMTSNWVDAFMWFLAAISLGGAGWAAVDGWKSRSKTPPPPSEEQK